MTTAARHLTPGPAPGRPLATGPASASATTPGGAIDAGSLGDDELDALVGVLLGEQRRRAIAQGDVVAVAAHAFETAFDRRGGAGDPVVEGRLLVCPGSVVAKSRTTQISKFVAVGEEWVWQVADCLHDEVRRGDGPALSTVTVVPLCDDLDVHVVTSKGPRGSRRLQEAVSYRVRGQQLERTEVRVPTLSGDR